MRVRVARQWTHAGALAQGLRALARAEHVVWHARRLAARGLVESLLCAHAHYEHICAHIRSMVSEHAAALAQALARGMKGRHEPVQRTRAGSQRRMCARVHMYTHRFDRLM